MNRAIRHDGGKPRYDLLPPQALLELVKIYTMGAEKYEPRNWEKGMAYSRCYASLMRHLQSFWMGTDLDGESGLHHMAHVAWNALAILQYQLLRTGEDDRPRVKSIHTDPDIYDMQDEVYETVKKFRELSGMMPECGEDYLMRGEGFDCRD